MAILQMQKSILSCIIILFLVGRSPARDYLFERISTNDGLTSNHVTTILQDSTGFMWFGTRKGLNIYDGNEVYQVVSSGNDSSLLADNDILDILQDIDGSVWIATAHGVSHINSTATAATHYRAGSSDSTNLSNDYAITLFKSSQNKLWVGTAWGLNRYNRENHTFRQFIFDSKGKNAANKNRIRAIAEAPDGFLWVGSDAGITLMEQTGDSCISLCDRQNAPSILGTAGIRDIIFANDGTAWIATNQGLISYQLSTNKFTLYKSKPGDSSSLSRNRVTSLHFDAKGALWVGTEWGLCLLDPSSGKFIQIMANPNSLTSLSENYIYSIYEDRSGILWIGTGGGGVNKYSLAKQHFHFSTIKTSKGLVDNNILWLFQKDKNRIWISSHSGVYEWNRQKNTYALLNTVYNSDFAAEGSFAKAFFHGTDNIFWIGADQGEYAGLYKYNMNLGKITDFIQNQEDSNGLSNNSILSICQDKRGDLWLGTEGAGVQRFDPVTGKTIKYVSDYKSSNLPGGNWIYCIMCDSKGFVWLGTDNGLSRFDAASNQFTTFRHNPKSRDNISSNRITALLEDKNGAIWIGTEGGLGYYLGGDSLKFYGRKEGLDTPAIRAILPDEKGQLWLSTSSGITQFQPQNESFRYFDEQDGLLAKDFNIGASLALSNGSLVFGAHNGLVWFNPESFCNSPIIPPVAITKISNYYGPLFIGKVVEHIDKIELPYKENFIEFEFSVLDYTNPNQNRFAYMLEGFDRNWRAPSNGRRATYPNLPPGKYVFHVRGATNISPWNREGDSLPVEIVAPFWLRRWFQMFVFLMLVGIFVLLSYVRHIRVKKQRLYLQKMVAERTQELETKNLELERAKEDYQNLYDNAPAGFHEINQDGVIIQTNDTACRILGFSKKEMISRSVFDFIVPEERDEARRTFFSIMSGEVDEGSLERTYIHKNSSPVILSIKFKITPNVHGQKIMLRNAFQNITEIRQLEEQLRQSQKLEAIGRLAGGIAHDFNNILTIIRGYCSLLLKKTKDTPPIHKTLARIDEAGERAEKLTRQLLAFSRRQQLQPQVLNLNIQVHQIKEMLSRLLGEKIEIRLELDKDLYNIKVDPDQLEHMLINMAANARDAMPEGGVITFYTKNIDTSAEMINRPKGPAPGKYALLIISDTGHGIEAETLEHIFEPFYSDKERGKGTGLGLAMVYGFVSQSKGRIAVYSKVGEGTSFQIYFPRSQEKLAIEEQLQNDAGDIEGNENILVVEDEDHVRGLIGTALKEHGYNVFLSTDKKEELDHLLSQQHEFDMILSDVIMPTQNGPQVVKYIQKYHPTIKVLFMSGYSDDLISSQGVLDKDVNFLQKPFTPEKLLKKIRDVLDGKKSADGVK